MMVPPSDKPHGYIRCMGSTAATRETPEICARIIVAGPHRRATSQPPPGPHIASTPVAARPPDCFYAGLNTAAPRHAELQLPHRGPPPPSFLLLSSLLNYISTMNYPDELWIILLGSLRISDLSLMNLTDPGQWFT
jgi:hypothetical protein